MAITEFRNLEWLAGMRFLVLLAAAAGCSSKSNRGDGAVVAGQPGQAGATTTASTIGNSLRNPSSVVPLAGLPFVVKLDDVPIYLGTFFRLFSSMIPVGPVIMVDNITDDLVPISAPKRAGDDLRFDPRIVQVLTETGKLVP